MFFLFTATPVPCTDMEAFGTTHFHVPVGVVVEKSAENVAEDGEGENAKQSAEVEGERYEEAEMEKKRQETERLEKARLRHKEALHKEMLKHVSY